MRLLVNMPREGPADPSIIMIITTRTNNNNNDDSASRTATSTNGERPARSWPRSDNERPLVEVTQGTVPLRTSTPQASALNVSERSDLSDSATVARSSSVFSLTGNEMELRLSTTRQAYTGDRYIPMRRGYSFEAAYYSLMKDTKFGERDNIPKKFAIEIDIREQIRKVEHMHQCKAMRAALVQFYLEPELTEKRILRLNNSTAQHEGDQGGPDWWCKPRQKKLIGSPDQMYNIDQSSFLQENSDSTCNMIDWSNLNVFAVAGKHTVRLLPDNALLSDIYVYTELRENDHIVAIKCSNDGSRMLVVSKRGNIMLLDIRNVYRSLRTWTTSCVGCTVYQDTCDVRGICWTEADREIVIVCNDLAMIYESKTGRLTKNLSDIVGGIAWMAFSSDFKYLASVTESLLQVHEWSDLSLFFVICTCTIIRTITWHPRQPILCINEDHGILVFWDIKKKTKIGMIRDKSICNLKHVLWNKLSGELVLHTVHADGHQENISVFSNITRIVDAIRISRQSNISFLMFNHAHDKLVSYSCKNDIFVFWNFFGHEKSVQMQYAPRRRHRRQTGPLHHTIR